jgi:hypothetical protein
MDYEKLNNISKELFKLPFKSLSENAPTLVLLVYNNLMTINEAKELIEYTNRR